MAGLLLKLLSFGIVRVGLEICGIAMNHSFFKLGVQIPDRHQQSAFGRIIASRATQQGNRKIVDG
jgi:hypothetical protein